MSRMPNALKHRISSESGISLLEIMLAIGIAVISISALTVIATTATRNVSNSRGHTIADQYARETITQMRSIRDNQGWASLVEANIDNPGQYKYYFVENNVLVLKMNSNTATRDCNDPMVKSLSGINLDSTNKQLVRTELTSGNRELRIKVMICYNITNSTWSQATLESILTNWR